MTDGDCEDGQPLKIELREVLGMIEDAPNEGRRLRLFNAEGWEFANLVGKFAGPAWVAAKGEQVAELAVSSGGLTAKVRIPLDQETRCIISPDGTVACTLPSGAQWATTPLWVEGGGS